METAVVTLVGQVVTSVFGFLGTSETQSAATEQARIKAEADVQIARINLESANRTAAAQLDAKKLEMEVAKDAQRIQLEIAKLENDHKSKQLQAELRTKLAGEQDQLIASQFATAKAEQSAKLELSNQQIVERQTAARNAALAMAAADEAKGLKLIPSDALALEEATPLAVGSLSEVFKGVYCGNTVAVKRFKQPVTTTPAALEALATAAAHARTALRHPNVVTFIGASVDAHKRLCLVLEYVAGIDLDAFLHTHKRVPSLPTAHRIGLELARTFAFVTAQPNGLALRELTSANVLLYGGANVKVTCIDWMPAVRARATLSSAHSTTSAATAAVAITTAGKTLTRQRGSHPEHYTAPEVFAGTNLAYNRSAAAVYAFAVLMSEVVTGERPYSEHKGLSSPTKLFARVQEGLRPSTGAFANTPLGKLLVRCWSGKPADRPSVAEVVAEFESFVATDAKANPIPMSQKSQSAGISTKAAPSAATATTTAAAPSSVAMTVSQSGKALSESGKARKQKRAAEKEHEQKKNGIHSLKPANKPSVSGTAPAPSSAAISSATKSAGPPSLHVSTKVMKFCPKCGKTAAQVSSSMSDHIQSCSA